MKRGGEGTVLTTLRLDKEVLQNFRMAVSRKHKGITRGTTFVELNNALMHWTKVMNEEIDSKKVVVHAPVFAPSK
jgi:hypothetical protein